MVCVLSTNTHFAKGRANDRKEVTGISEAASAAADEKHHEKLIVIVLVDLVGWMEASMLQTFFLFLSLQNIERHTSPYIT